MEEEEINFTCIKCGKDHTLMVDSETGETYRVQLNMIENLKPICVECHGLGDGLKEIFDTLCKSNNKKSPDFAYVPVHNHIRFKSDKMGVGRFDKIKITGLEPEKDYYLSEYYDPNEEE